MADSYDPDDAFENGMWNSDAEPYDVQNTDYFEQQPYNAPSHMSPEQEPQPKKIRRWPWVALGCFVVLLIAVGIYAFSMVNSVNSVKAKAQTTMNYANGYMSAAKSRNSEQLQKSASDLSKTAHDLHNELASPGWSIAAMMPVVGSDVNSVRVLSDVLVDVSDNALTPLAQNSGVMNLSNLIGDGSVNVTALTGLANAVQEAAPVITRSAQAIEALPKANIPQVSTVLESVREKVKVADNLVTRVGPLVPSLPAMLGANGQTRNYLVLAQNNSEVHATGGFVGSVGHITVTDGNIQMGDFESVYDMLSDEKLGLERGEVPAGATEEEIAVFSEQINKGHGDHNYTPDFTRVGEMYYNVNKTINNEEVDGVIAFDVVFLQYMLKLVGRVDTSFDVYVDGNDAAPVILNQCLFWWSPQVCDAFYAEVSKNAFSKVLGGLGGADNSAFFNTIVKSADEGRCVAWMRDPQEEEAIKAAGFGWELGHDVKKPMLNIVNNDFSYSKDSYYLSVTPVVGNATKNADGSTTYPITVTVRNNMPRSVLEDGLPSYLTGRTPHESRSAADLFQYMYLIGPEGGKVQNITFRRENSYEDPSPEMSWQEMSYQGLDTWRSTLRLDSEETVVLDFEVVTSTEATEPLTVRKSPVVPPEVGGWPA